MFEACFRCGKGSPDDGIYCRLCSSILGEQRALNETLTDLKNEIAELVKVMKRMAPPKSKYNRGFN